MGQNQDYFTNKAYSVGKSDSLRDVTQRHPLRPSEQGFKIIYFSNIHGDCRFLCIYLLSSRQ